jgi:hypothetical protein
MPLPTSTSKIIASGAWAQIRVREKSTDPLKVIGLCSDASFNESFNLQEANVVGHLGPISIDSQGYRCSIQIGVFVPEKKEQGGQYADGGDTTLADLLPTRSDVMLNGKGKTFEYLDFYNSATKEVLNAFSHAIISDDGARIGANAYITNNISLQAIERTL